MLYQIYIITIYTRVVNTLWMNSFILYISFPHCSLVNLRLLALEMLFLSAASRLQKQSSDKFPSSLWCPGYKWGVGGAVAAPGVKPSPGLWSSKNTQENHNFFFSFNSPSPRLSRSHSADSGPTAPLTPSAECSSAHEVLYVHISIASFPDAIFFI